MTLFDPVEMRPARALAKTGEPPFREAVDSLKAEADRLLDDGPWSVVHKTKMPPDGNKHDCYSLGITRKNIPADVFEEIRNGYELHIPACSRIHLLYPDFNQSSTHERTPLEERSSAQRVK